MTSAGSALQFTNARVLADVGIAGWLGTMSQNTAKAYATDMRLFCSWLAERHIDPDSLTPGTMTAYLAELASAGRSAATQRRKLAAVRSFYSFAAGEGVKVPIPSVHKAPKVHRDDADPGSIDRRQAHLLWNATEGQPRARALVAVMLLSGLRVSEALNLQVTDLVIQQGAKVVRVMGKGGKPRTAVLAAPAVVAISEWLHVRGSHDGPLFSTRTGAALDVRAARRLVLRLGTTAGIVGLHPHSLRHTFATSAIDAGADVLKVATALGHSSPTTTMRYIRGRDVITSSPVHAVADAILSG